MAEDEKLLEFVDKYPFLKEIMLKDPIVSLHFKAILKGMFTFEEGMANLIQNQVTDRNRLFDGLKNMIERTTQGFYNG